MRDEIAIIRMLVMAEILKFKRDDMGHEVYHYISKELVKHYGSQMKLAEALKERGCKGNLEAIRKRVSKYENGKSMPSIENGELLIKLFSEVKKEGKVYEAILEIMDDEELKE